VGHSVRSLDGFRIRQGIDAKRREGRVISSADSDTHESALVVVVASFPEAMGKGLDMVFIDSPQSDLGDVDLTQLQANAYGEVLLRCVGQVDVATSFPTSIMSVTGSATTSSSESSEALRRLRAGRGSTSTASGTFRLGSAADGDGTGIGLDRNGGGPDATEAAGGAVEGCRAAGGGVGKEQRPREP